MSGPYEVITIFENGSEDTWPCSSLDAAYLRMDLKKKESAVFIQVRESRWKILKEWRRSQEAKV